LDSLDVKLALRVARRVQAEAILVSLGNGDYLWETFAIASHYNGGMVYYSGSAHMLHALEQLSFDRWNLVQTGMSGDMLMGSFLKAADIYKPLKSVQSVTERVIVDLGHTDWIGCLTRDPAAARQLVEHSVRASLEKIGPDSSGTMAQALELWNLYNRQQRSMFNGFRMIENYAEYSSPFFDADLYQYTLKIPHRHRLEEAIYVDMLSSLLPRPIWRIPWQKTGRSPSKYKRINKFNQQSTSWLGRGMRVIFPQAAGRKWSMNPFRAWLLANSRLRQFVVEQLLSWDSVPYPLERSYVQAFANDIANGKINKRLVALVFRLLTLKAWDLRIDQA
jgi:hypothetical protein